MEDSLNELADVVAHMRNESHNHELKEAIKISAIGLRSLYIRQDSNRNLTSSLFVQRLKNLELERVHVTEDNKLTLLDTNKNNTILRTKLVIPTPVRIKGDLFLYVGDINNQNPYTETEFTELEFIKHNKFTKAIPRYIFIDRRLYILNATVSRITVHLIPDDPREVNRIAGCGCVFDEDNDKFIDSQDMKVFIMTELARMYMPPVENNQIQANKI